MGFCGENWLGEQDGWREGSWGSRWGMIGEVKSIGIEEASDRIDDIIYSDKRCL